MCLGFAYNNYTYVNDFITVVDSVNAYGACLHS